MKTRIFLYILMISILLFPTAVMAESASQPIRIIANGEKVNFWDDEQPFQSEEGNLNVYVSVKGIASRVGIDITEISSDEVTFSYGQDKRGSIAVKEYGGVAYVDLDLLCQMTDVDFSYDSNTNTYTLIREIPVEDIYGFKVKYDKYNNYNYTATKLSVFRGPYDKFGNDYAQLSLMIGYDEPGGDIPGQVAEVEQILKQKIASKVVDSIIKYIKSLKDTVEMKEFKDSNYEIIVTSDLGGVDVSVFKRPIPSKITKEDASGFKISYDKSSRFSKNRLTIMKGPFSGDELDHRYENGLFIIGIAYERKATNISDQYAEASAILKQKVDAQQVNAIINQSKTVKKNGDKGIATKPKKFQTNTYDILVSGGPSSGVEILISSKK